MRQILILDANISFAVAIKRSLEAIGQYHVRSVTRVRPAVDALENQVYDLAIIDTVLTIATLADAVIALRQIQPNLLILVSSSDPNDQRLVTQFDLQGFVQKPYVARMVIPIIEDVLGRGFMPTVQTAPVDLAYQLEEQDRQQILEPMLEATRQTLSTLMSEPPLEADDSTISEIMDNALKPEVSQKIYATLDPTPAAETLPATDRPLLAAPLSPSDTQSLPATETLTLTSGVENLDGLLEQIRQFATGVASGRSNRQQNLFSPPEPLAAQVVLPHPHIPMGMTTGNIKPIRSDEETQAAFIPPPPRLPDQEWIENYPAPLFLPEETFPDETLQLVFESVEALVPTTIEEMTQQLVAVEEEAIEASVNEEAEAQRIPEHVLAHYALHLTQFAMESSSIAAMIARDHERLAQAGDLSESLWAELTQLIGENWREQGDSRIRVLYRRVEIGEILIYSIQTVMDLNLTLIFSAETPLKIIRRQAARLTDALKNVPPPSEASLYTQAVESERDSRLTEDDRREGFPEPASAVSFPEEPPQEQLQSPPPVQRPVGSYTNYACLWLVEDPKDAINAAAAQILTGWLGEICREQDWDLDHCQIDREWLSVVVGVPMGTLPSQLAQTLMGSTADRALALDPQHSMKSPWAEGYLVRTPPDALQEADIQRFIQFYRSTQKV